MKVVVHRRASRYLERLAADQKDNVKGRLKALAQDPFGQQDVQEMKGRWEGYYRLRIGGLRVIFTVDRQAQVLYVDHIGPRGDVYK
jgi:mRNA interferase RelE/StbE